MLVSVNVDHASFFAGLQAVVVDEVHAFADHDRGWHLLAVLERLTHLIGHPVQRVGLALRRRGQSVRAADLVQGSGSGSRPSTLKLTARATDRLAFVRDERRGLVHPGGNVIVRTSSGDVRWWTWAGFRANATLAATLSGIADPLQRFDDQHIRLREDLTPEMWRDGSADASERLCLPEVSEKALFGLKFSDALPKRLAIATLAARLADLDGAGAVLAEPSRFVTS